jgi:hypothetical protein
MSIAIAANASRASELAGTAAETTFNRAQGSRYAGMKRLRLFTQSSPERLCVLIEARFLERLTASSLRRRLAFLDLPAWQTPFAWMISVGRAAQK